MRDLGAVAVGIGSAPPPGEATASAECCRTIPWCWWCLGSDPEVELLSLPCWAPISMPGRGRPPQTGEEGEAVLVGAQRVGFYPLFHHSRRIAASMTRSSIDNFIRILRDNGMVSLFSLGNFKGTIHTLPHNIRPPLFRLVFLLSPLLLPSLPLPT